ncbi:MAG: acetate kinase [Phenylobacterium zucineum]|nr:MAG: acetate kinase [Phenylobacterium zucineum]
MIKALLVLNCGSSSLKFQAVRYDDLEVLISGAVSGIGTGAVLSASLPGAAEPVRTPLVSHDHDAALAAVLDLIDAHDDDWALAAVVHRVVHGGIDFREPVIVTPEIVARLRTLSPLAPLHQPHNLAGLAASERLAPTAPDIACFDTAFHAGHDDLTTAFALPREVREKGVRRYGFHGLSYEWISRRLREVRPDLAAGRVVAAHLGNGASLCALMDGVSVETTMGMTALDGLPMGTRSGALDPGAVTYLIRELGYDAAGVERLLYEQSGLKGLSGLTNDVRALEASDAPEARFALDYFARKVAQQAAVMAVSMGGIDAMVFTAGIGEHARAIRAAVVAQLAFLGPFEVLVEPANEERMMAIHAKALLGG